MITLSRPARVVVTGVLALMGVVAAAWAAASLTWPYQVDHGAYAWMAQAVRAGGAPYVDAWDVKGPATLLPFLLADLLLGGAPWAIRLLDLALVALTGWTIYRLVLPAAPQAIATIAALAWILAYATLGFTNTAQPDGWVGMLALVAVAPALRAREPRWWHAALPAAVAGGALLVKPFYVLYLAAALALAWGARPGRTTRLAVLAGAALLPVAAIAAWLAAAGALGEMLDAYLGFNLGKNAGGLVPVVLAALSYGLLQDPALLLLAPVGAAGAWWLWSHEPHNRNGAVVLMVLVAVGVVAGLVQRPWYAYRALPILPPLVALAGIGAGALAIGGTAMGRALVATAGALLALHVVREPAADGIRTLRLVAGGERTAYNARFAFHGATAADEMRVARWLRESTPEGEPVFAWTHVAILAYADRPAASRLLLPVAVSSSAPEPWRSRFIAELDSVLGTRPPTLVLEAAGDTALAALAPLPLVGAAALDGQYDLALAAGPLRVYRRR